MQSPESASSMQWVARSSARASMNTAMTLAYHKVPHQWRFVSHISQTASD
jgi:ribosomal protein L16/L10AE